MNRLNNLSDNSDANAVEDEKQESFNEILLDLDREENEEALVHLASDPQTTSLESATNKLRGRESVYVTADSAEQEQILADLRDLSEVRALKMSRVIMDYILGRGADPFPWNFDSPSTADHPPTPTLRTCGLAYKRLISLIIPTHWQLHQAIVPASVTGKLDPGVRENCTKVTPEQYLLSDTCIAIVSESMGVGRRAVITSDAVKDVPSAAHKDILRGIGRRSPLVLGLMELVQNIESAEANFQQMFRYQQNYLTSSREYLIPTKADKKRQSSLRQVWAEVWSILRPCLTLDWTAAKAHAFWKIDRFTVLVWNAIGQWFYDKGIDASSNWPWLERYKSNLLL